MLVNTSDIFIKNTILTSFEYFLGLSWPFSINSRSAKYAAIRNSYIESVDIEDICIWGACVSNTFTGDIYIKNFFLL